MRRKDRIIYILLIALFLGVSVDNSHAISDKSLNITMNKESMVVREVPIIMNEKVVKTDTPSFLYIDRTLVPARLISENYGAKVVWDQKTETATISHNGKIVDLKINSQTAKVNGKDYKLDKYSTPRLVNFGGNSAHTMVPLTFLVEEVLGYETDWDYEQRAAYIKETDKVVEQKPEIKPVPKPTPKPEPEVEKKPVINNSVLDASMEKRNGNDVIVIKGTGKVKRNVINLNNPNRIVIDLMESELKGATYKNFDYTVGVIKSVRMSQFIPDTNYNEKDSIVRVVLDIRDGEKSPKVKITEEGNNLVLEPERSFWDNIEFDKNSKTLRIKNMTNTSYSVDYDKRKDEMNISVPSNAVGLNSGSVNISDNLLGNLDIIERGNTTNIKILFKRGVNYNVTSSNPGDEIEIKFSRDQEIRKSDRIIVIDPGHGGTDPGAVSSSGTREKDIAFDVSMRVNNKLKSLGYKTITTRDKDVFITLDNRPKIANENYADIFVSIHANSAVPTAKGIETYVPITVTNPIKKEQGDSLAKLVQEELIKETKATNRGVKQANHLVTRKSDMAAILVEVGFLSNPAEESLLKTEAYRDRLADAVVKGIERYFEIY